MSGTWPMVCLDVAIAVAMASLAKWLSDSFSSPTQRWLWFVGLATMLLLLGVALPLRVCLQRQQRGMAHATRVARQQAVTDPLTGLLNRRSLDEVVSGLERTKVPFSVAICDLDHFKDLNDSFGHESGDQALRLFANTLRSVVRAGDYVSRHGGEEFVLILPNSSKTSGSAVLERARHELHAQLSGVPVPSFTFSAGVADTDEAGEWSALLHLADQRLLAAKRAGRDRVLTVSGAFPA
jgi:diguanylate cyclase (GGDEF)-like protein